MEQNDNNLKSNGVPKVRRFTEEEIDYLRSQYSYDGKGGLISKCNGLLKGCKNNNGYLLIYTRFGHISYHRLVWIVCTGREPEHTIDHINHDKSDNRIENLRDVTIWENCQNKDYKPNPVTGYVGIYPCMWLKTGVPAGYHIKYKGISYYFHYLKDAVQFRISHNLKI